MEKNSRTSIVIEFNGLPGTGKTTISNYVQELFTQNGYTCCRSYHKYPFQEHGITAYLDLSCIKLLYHTKRFINSIRPKKKAKDCQTGLLCFFRMYRDFLHNKPFDVLLVDQGIIQEIVSMIHDGKDYNTICIGNIVRFLSQHNIKYYRVDCWIDPLLSYNRINSRPTKGSRFDRMPQESLIDSLCSIEKVFDDVRAVFNKYNYQPVVTIDTKLEPLDNAKTIYNSLTSKI